MLYYNKIDIREGIDLAKSNNRKECMICHCWFFNHEFKFQDSVCNGSHDLTMLSVNISDISIISIKNVDNRCTIHNISKSEAINLLKSSALEDRGYIYKKILSWTSIKSLDISIGTVMKNPEMLKFLPDRLKTKDMWKHAVKKLPYLLDMFMINIRLNKRVIKLF